MTVEPRVLSVAIEQEAPPDAASAVESVLARYGIGAEVKTASERRSADVMPWLIEVAVVGSMATFFLSFGSTFGRTAASDAYPLVTEWIKALGAARAGSGTGEGRVAIIDTDSTTLVVDTRIPDDALDALADVQWDSVRGRCLVWDETARTWLDPRQKPE